MNLTLSASLRPVPSTGLGKVVKTTAVSSEFCRISSLRIRCCARHGRSLKESGIADCSGKPEACDGGGCALAIDDEVVAVIAGGVLGKSSDKGGEASRWLDGDVTAAAAS